MRIPLTAFFGPDGSRQSIASILGTDETESILTTGISAITNKLLDSPSSSFLGNIHQSMGIQMYAYISCTGWLILIGLEPGPYDTTEIARSFLERAYEAVVEASMNPFMDRLDGSSSFARLLDNSMQSHSVMMRFMASSHTLT